MLLIITSTSDKLLNGVKIDELEPLKGVLKFFKAIFGCSTYLKTE